ncbi:LuxR C-terminal-related transcriptional regulator [Kibdelosporangium persicum]|uniref:Helix-turn-helix transcriptional regulator n=1 Tax=Kibdelosporangium persicum TaxID=2698649 RepID=A0ABX2FGQ5_9PSEU|nr:LuxR C-terminal-related transcriptional regulator [Kibdelosporangium persicum]NRN70413.1 Helix-turn-helix transcriptional regulator [Kibdelosporangium persicum]
MAYDCTAPTLGVADLHRVIAVLEDSTSSRNAYDFRELVIDALGRHLGLRNTTFFVGPTFAQVFTDQAPVANGIAARMVPAYVEEFHRDDPFAHPAAWAGYRGGRPLRLNELRPVLELPRHRRYLDKFLLRNGIRDKVVVPLVADRGLAGGIGVLEQEAVTARHRAILELLGRHLGQLLALHARATTQRRPEAAVSPRQVQTADLVTLGLTNRQIADVMCVGIDTVKKHITAVMKATGCTSRTQLALHWAGRSNPVQTGSRPTGS